MKVVKAFGPGDLRIMEIPVPIPGPGKALVRVRASGICGSDKWFWRVARPVDDVAGHEISGEVVDVGPGVRSLKPGDRVAINNVVGCGRCDDCRKGDFVRCANRPGKDVNNGFAEYVAAPERNCLKLDRRISFEAGCLIFDNWGTPFAAIRRAGVKAGDSVIVTGCGPIGLAAVKLCVGLKASVIAVDPVEYRRNIAGQLGAAAVLAPDVVFLSRVRELTAGRGADIVLECSGKGLAYAAGLSVLRVGGTFVAIGEGAQFDLHPSELIIRNHLNLLGSWYTTMNQGREVQALMLRRKIPDPSVFVTHRPRLEDLPRVFGKIADCADGVLKAVVTAA